MSIRKSTCSFVIRDLEAWKQFIELSRKDGLSASEMLERMIVKYVHDHSPGNPQLDMGKFLSPPMAKTVCPNGARFDCPQRPGLCVLRVRYACKFESR